MLQDAGNETILSLANLLKDHQVHTKTITQALELICNGFSFDCGFVFETDFSGGYSLMEHYGVKSHLAQERYVIESAVLQEQAHILCEPITSIKRTGKNSSFELELLDLCHAYSLVFVPVTDESWGTYSFVVLANTAAVHPGNQAALNSVAVALSLLFYYMKGRMYQKKLTQSQATLESILDHAGVDIYVNDFYSHDILYTNEPMAAPYGGKEQFIGKKCWQVLFPGQSGPCDFCPQKKLIDENGNPTKVYSWDYQRAFDGAWFRVFSASFHWVDGRLAHVVSSADITENKRNEALIENLANYDQLTQLPNRRSLLNECERRIKRATEREQGYVMFFDIDGFKAINDNYGHDAGDEFLVQLAAFFSDIPLLKGSIYRNGGDEFVALLGGETITKEHIKHLSNFIHDRFKKAWVLKNGSAYCNISIGVACYPEDGTTPQELLQKADMAMYHIKKCGGGGFCFNYQCAQAAAVSLEK